jgi:hypothetical protein
LEGSGTVGRFWHCCQDNFDVDLNEIGCDTDWIELPQDMVHWWNSVNMVMNISIPQKARNI